MGDKKDVQKISSLEELENVIKAQGWIVQEVTWRLVNAPKEQIIGIVRNYGGGVTFDLQFSVKENMTKSELENLVVKISNKCQYEIDDVRNVLSSEEKQQLKADLSSLSELMNELEITHDEQKSLMQVVYNKMRNELRKQSTELLSFNPLEFDTKTNILSDFKKHGSSQQVAEALLNSSCALDKLSNWVDNKWLNREHNTETYQDCIDWVLDKNREVFEVKLVEQDTYYNRDYYIDNENNYYQYDGDREIFDQHALGYVGKEDAEGYHYFDSYGSTDNTTNKLVDVVDEFDNYDPKVVPAKTLEGWSWVKYNDGSGHLESPNGDEYMAYNLSSNEYCVTRKDNWDYLPLDCYYADGIDKEKFKPFEWMEQYMTENVINKEQEKTAEIEHER